MNQPYPAKILLFGEHAVLDGGEALAMAWPEHSARWVRQVQNQATDQPLRKSQVPNRDPDLQKALQQYVHWLQADRETWNEYLDMDALEAALGGPNPGFWLDSDIPHGYGLGSSGSVCAALFDTFGRREILPAGNADWSDSAVSHREAAGLPDLSPPHPPQTASQPSAASPRETAGLPDPPHPPQTASQPSAPSHREDAGLPDLSPPHPPQTASQPSAASPREAAGLPDPPHPPQTASQPSAASPRETAGLPDPPHPPQTASQPSAPSHREDAGLPDLSPPHPPQTASQPSARGPRETAGRAYTLQQGLAIFSKMEAFFHGSSSGTDPLISYLGARGTAAALRFGAGRPMEVLPMPLAGWPNGLQITVGPAQANDNPSGNTWRLELLDTQQPRQTAPLVNEFRRRLGDPEFRGAVQNELIPANAAAIQALLAGNADAFGQALRNISFFTLQRLTFMIPEAFPGVWGESLKRTPESGATERMFKLCGAGGGGYIQVWVRG